MSKAVKREPWTLRKTVLPQHTDHSGVMWHGSYFNLLEEARINSLSQVGLSYANISQSGYEMPVVEMKIKYLSSLHHGDEVLLQSWLLEFKGARLPWKTIFLKDNGKHAAEAIVHLVILKKEESGVRVIRRGSKQILEALNKLKRGPN